MNSLSQNDFDNKYQQVKQRFLEFGSRVEFLRNLSKEAAAQFEDESIDFAYIDGNHEYKAVLEDILTWYPKIKKGGYLCGDDVYSTNLDEHDTDGNVLRIWSRDYYGNPSCWGKYGTYSALLTAQKTLHFNYKIDQTQFIIQKE